MKQKNSSALRGFALLALWLLAGCGTANQLPSSSSQTGGPSGGQVRPMWTCEPVSNASNFNGTAIAPGSWIWFSSVFSEPGYSGSDNIYITNSTITFTANGTTYSIAVPDSDVWLASGNSVSLNEYNNAGWFMSAPPGTSGNDFLGGASYYTAAGLPGGINPVTWSATFHSSSGHKINWQWAAAVYTQFNGTYQSLAVKPLDDNHYAPYNSDHAGTPENYKGYVTGGARGGGGSNYTGSYSGTVGVTPCLAN